jgi:hypothetical protein
MALAVPAGRDKLAASYASGTLTLALTTTAPSGATPGTEVSGGGYARVTPTVTTPASGSRALAATFTLAGGVTIAGWALYDGATLVDVGTVSSTSSSPGTLALTVTFTQS